MSKPDEIYSKITKLLSGLLVVTGLIMYLLGSVGTGFSFGDRKGKPNWDGGGQQQSMPWWGPTGIGLSLLAFIYFGKSETKKKKKKKSKNKKLKNRS